MQTLKSIGAVLAGFVAVFNLSIATDAALEALGVFPHPDQGLFIPWMLILATFYRNVYAILGGYITAWLAPDRPMRHVLILAIMGTLGALVGLINTWNMNLGPRWYPIALVVLAFPSVYLGGKIEGKKQIVIEHKN